MDEQQTGRGKKEGEETQRIAKKQMSMQPSIDAQSALGPTSETWRTADSSGSVRRFLGCLLLYVLDWHSRHFVNVRCV
jgi:hypothetical protein